MYICKSLAIISNILCECVCVCVRTCSATTVITIGRTQCAHKLAFINNPKRLVPENDREREKSPFPHTRSILLYYYVLCITLLYVFMYKRRIRCQITPSMYHYYIILRGISALNWTLWNNLILFYLFLQDFRMKLFS